jgi:hypothetical protein
MIMSAVLFGTIGKSKEWKTASKTSERGIDAPLRWSLASSDEPAV